MFNGKISLWVVRILGGMYIFCSLDSLIRGRGDFLIFFQQSPHGVKNFSTLFNFLHLILGIGLVLGKDWARKGSICFHLVIGCMWICFLFAWVFNDAHPWNILKCFMFVMHLGVAEALVAGVPIYFLTRPVVRAYFKQTRQ